MNTSIDNTPNPSQIMQVGMQFFSSKILLSAVNMGLFTLLAEKPLNLKAIKKHYSWNCTERHALDFLDALFVLKFLKREGIYEDSVYSNTVDTDFFLDKNKPTYIGGMLEMCNNRLYPFWGNLEMALETGKLQNEAAEGGEGLFEAIYKDPKRLREFVHAMTGFQMGSFISLAHSFDFGKYETLCDMGGAGAMLSIQVALANPHLKCISVDLPPVEPIAKENIEKFGLQNRIVTENRDFFSDDFPKADVLVMGNILHDWGLDKKLILMQKAYDALPDNGVFIVIEAMVDDNRSEDIGGLLSSLNMLIETEEGFNFSMVDFEKWSKKIGFKRTNIIALEGNSSAAIAYK